MNAIKPCQFLNEGWRARAADPANAAVVERVISGIPMGRMGEPEELLGPVLFLAWYLSGPLVAIAALIVPLVLALHTPTADHLLLAVCASGAVTAGLLRWAYARAGKLLE